MQTYLHIHPTPTSSAQMRYRGTYSLLSADYELSRTVGRRGDSLSELKGGKIRVAISGALDSQLMSWVVDSVRAEDGMIHTLDESERTISKLHFRGGKVRAMQLSYDSQLKDGLVTVLTFEAQEISSDNDLYFERKR